MKDLSDSIVLGTHYYRQPTPKSNEWADDLKSIKSLGMSMIQLRPQWCWHEREEGSYTWDDIDRLLELAEKNGLDVMFKFMLETAPEFVFRKYGGYRIGLKGERIWPIAHGAFYPGGWLPCFDNPQVITAAKRFVTDAVKRYSGCETIKIWHAWNEPRSRPVGECCCEHSLESYRQWLRGRFGSIDALNDFVGKCWLGFETIDVPRDTADFAEMHLWRTWAATRVAWRVKEVADAIKSVDSSRPVIAHVGNPSIVQDVMCDTSDDYLTRKSVDMYGTSFEMRCLPKYIEDSMPFMQNDWMRSISGDGYYWVNELYPSLGSWMREVPADRVVMWLWASVACGAKGVIFWQYKKERVGCETNDAGMVEVDGSDNPTSIALAEAFDVINKNSGLLAAAKAPMPKVAIVYDFASDLFDRIQESKHLGDFNLSVKYPTMLNSYKTNLQFVYYMFWAAGIPVDVISSHELEAINSYAATYLPMFFSVDERQSQIFSDYVKNGGKLIADGGVAQREPGTMLQVVRPGVGLTELFGAKETFRISDDNDVRKVIMSDKTELPSRKINASFELQGGKAIACYEDGTIAMVEKSFGKGKSVMTGFNPGMAYMFSQDVSWINWLKSFMRSWAGIESGQDAATPQLFVRHLECDGGKIYFLFNMTSQPQQWTSPGNGDDLTALKPVSAAESVQIESAKVKVILIKGSNLPSVNR